MDQLGQHGQHGQHGHQGRRTDEFGNPIADAYGNPVGQQGYGHETGVLGTGTGHGVGTGAGHTGGAFTHGSGGTAQMVHPEQHQQKGGGILHRSGSSSSSSSEDDGMGGRRKKGLKQKIKEKLPGHQKTDEYGQPIQAGTGYGGTGAATGYGGTGAATGYGGTTGTGTGHDTAGYREPEKKGMMEKIKEKLPGGHH